MSTGLIPYDDSGKPVLGLMDDATGKVVPVHVGSKVTGADGKTYAILDVNASVSPPSAVVDATNSSTTLLTANSVFTGTSQSGLAYGSISVEVFADQASAANGLVIQQSQDGNNWDTKNQYTISANTAFQQTINLVGQYYQVKYTNGGTNQGVFRLQTIKLPAPSPSAGVANQRVNAQSGDFVAGSITDLATLAGIVSSNKAAVKAASGDIADGALATMGAKADSAVTDSTTTNSQMSFIKGFVKMLADMWDSTNHWLQVKVMNANANGQTTMNASAPVVIASDQSKLPTKATSGDFADGAIATIGAQADASAAADNSTASYISLFKRLLAKFPTIGAQATSASMAVNIASDQIVPVKRNSVAVYSLASTTTSGTTQNSGDLTVGPYTEIGIDINTTAQAGTSPTLQLFWERKGADGIYYVLWQTNVLTAATNTISTSIGAGMAYNQSLGLTGRLRWVVGGSATPTYTFSANVYGK